MFGPRINCTFEQIWEMEQDFWEFLRTLFWENLLDWATALIAYGAHDIISRLPVTTRQHCRLPIHSQIFMNRDTCFKCSLHKVCLKMINSRCYAIMREHFIDIAVSYLATNVQNISAIVLNSSNLSCKSWLGDSSALRHRSVHLCCQAHQIAIVVWCLTRHKKSCHLVGRRWNPSDYLKTCFYEAWLHISSQWWEPFSQKFSVWPQFIIFEVLVLNTWEKYSQKMKIN